MISKRMGLLKLKEWYEKMLEVAKSRSIVVDFQDMLEEYKDIENVAEIPVFAGDHWAASMAIKITELKDKVRELSKKRGHSHLSNNGGSSNGLKAEGVTGSEKQDATLLNQISEEMKSMRNHFIVVRLIELKRGQKLPEIDDPNPDMSNDTIDLRSSFLEKCQMYHWQFDELRNAQHSTLMLLYYLHGMHKEAAERRKRDAQKALLEKQNSQGDGGKSRSWKIEMAMNDWTQLLEHANKETDAAVRARQQGLEEVWELPPEDLFLRILAQINRSKRDILQEKYNQCRDPSTSPATRSVFIRVLKRIAESFMSCLLSMAAKR